MQIVIPAEKLAAAANKYLVPAAIRKLEQEQGQSEERITLKKTDSKQLAKGLKEAI